MNESSERKGIIGFFRKLFKGSNQVVQELPVKPQGIRLSPRAQQVAEVKNAWSGGKQVEATEMATTNEERLRALQQRMETTASQIPDPGTVTDPRVASGSGDVKGEVTGGFTEKKPSGFNPSS